ncbi:E3 ubiquitin-protein ligase SH3RF1 [Drosophila subpulchrella]|uniref:E3 ubiquitin-protein ligase SH3RF1 n=1 Tax=Drosophila subpulchrella TaxID=1486046 RepID=UPI0018A1388D|nr:E3 ubiquitin-protein ligase SH3RF1 [Drosophila subpulchrella]
MDEHTLNDLLECSVCLERLDTTSKVLPCQHTFCRKCLLDIVASQHKLRCPECRILVSCNIDELPPNVLLMRILEGMKQNAAAGKGDSKGEETESQPERPKTQPSAEPVAPPGNQLLQQQTHQPSQQPTRHKQRRFLLPHAYALFDFASSEATDLKFKKGDLILLKHRIDNNWFVGQANGQEGTFPINYVKVSVPLPMPQCIAMYDFKMGPNDEEGCLEFKKSTVIHVMRRVDHNWAEGRIGQSIGIFPIAFVELNAAAKKLLDSGVINVNHPTCHPPQQQGQRALPPVPVIDPTVVTESSSGSSNSTPASSNSSSTSSSNNCSPNHQSSLPNTPQHVVASGSASVRFRDKGAKEKRHSLNALLGGGAPLSLLQTNRHSAEILSLPHELSRLEMANNSPAPKPTSATQSSRVLKTNVQQQMPPNLPWGYLALFPYKPRQTDELELKKGCVYIVTERCVDGWFKGKNWLDITGVFPGNYLTPLRTRDQQQLMHQWKYVPQSSDVQQAHPQQQPVAPDVRLNNMLPMQPPDLPPRQQQANATTTSCSVWTKPVEALFSRKSEPKPETAAASATSSSSSSGAVGLMRRLTHMKTRSKSPGASLQHAPKEVTSPNVETTTKPAAKLHPVHVRSGSCPSQLQHSQPLNETPTTKPAPQQQPFLHKQLPAHTNSSVLYGSQRLKGNKDRPPLICARQSLDAATFRSMYSNAASPPPPASSVAPAIYAGGQQQALPGGGPQSQLHANMIIAPSHRKSHSLDAGHVLSAPSSNVITEAAIKASATTKSAYCTRESRFRCIVPYPPNSDIELELHLGDIIYVQRKQKNGWYKGTHARTHKTGLFPASFVEPDC